MTLQLSKRQQERNERILRDLLTYLVPLPDMRLIVSLAFRGMANAPTAGLQIRVGQVITSVAPASLDLVDSRNISVCTMCGYSSETGDTH